MYVTETTAAERAIICNAVFSEMEVMDNALLELCDLRDEYFCFTKQEAISAENATCIARRLDMITSYMFGALLDYALTIGNKDFHGVEIALKSAERARTAIECEEANNKAISAGADVEKLKQIRILPDQEAIHAFNALIKELGA